MAEPEDTDEQAIVWLGSDLQLDRVTRVMQSASQPGAEAMAEMISRIVLPSMVESLAPLLRNLETALSQLAVAYQENTTRLVAGFALGIQAAIDNADADAWRGLTIHAPAATAVAVAVAPTVQAGAAVDAILDRAERADDHLDKAFYASIAFFLLWYWRWAVTNHETGDVFETTILALMLLQQRWEATRRKAS